MEPIKGHSQPIEADEKDWGKDDMDDAVYAMENKQEEVLTLPMQPMALEAARETMERKENLKREKNGWRRNNG